MSEREVWVTGVGAVTAAGLGAHALLELLLAERSELHALAELGGVPAGRAPELPRSAATRILERSAAMFVSAAAEAWNGAGLEQSEVDPRRCAVIEGSSLGPLAQLLDTHRRHLSERSGGPLRPSHVIRFMIGAGGALVAQTHGLCGPVWHVAAGSVSAACALGQAYREIRQGSADVVIAGGAECPLEPEIVESFRAAGILASGGEHSPPACRPFDARRNGTLLGEGAGVLVLESSDHARRRGAQPRATLAGFGFFCEAHSMTAPDPDGTAVREAAAEALIGLGPEPLGWVKAHGTGTTRGDAAECHGLARALGEGLRDTPITSLKSTLGHCLGASGAVEAVASILALESGVIPATTGTEEIDPELPPCRVATRLLECRRSGVLLLSESFGGRCAALALRRA